MEENEKPDVFNQNTPQQPPISEAERQMILNREKELEERGKANPITNSIQPVLPGKNITPLVEPDFGSDYDMLPLPSEGKVYAHKKASLKVSFLNAADENILTNPNLLKSGKFLEVLFTRKILDTTISYRDLLVGDRDAIMIWLRSTGYGTNYPIEVMDPKSFEEFTTEIDLDELKTKKLKIEPNEEGYFDYELPASKKKIKFKFLTVGDAEDIEKRSEELKKNPTSTFDLATFTLQKQIVEVEGNRDPLYIRDFVGKMRMADSRAFKKYVTDNECGIDLNLVVQAPGGGQVKTFFPLNPAFFWPEL
jgi:hypothetical protein